MKKYLKQQQNKYITTFILLIMFSINGIGAISIKYSLETTASASGNEIQIKSKYGRLEKPNIKITPKGESFVVWQDRVKKRGYDIFMQRFSKTGTPIGRARRINQYKNNDQKEPQIAMDKEGNFVIVWQSYGQDGNKSGIYGQRFTVSGKKVGSEFKVNTYILGGQTNPSIAMSEDGDFIVTWVSEKQDKTAKSIFAQKFDKNGKKIKKEFQINSKKHGTQINPRVSIDKKKNFLIVWQGQRGRGDWDIYGKTFEWDKENIEKEDEESKDILINTKKGLDQKNANVISVEEKKFMVIWENTSFHKILKESKIQNIKGQIIYNGKKSGKELEITESIFGHQREANIIKTEQNGAIITMVVWQNFNKFKDEKGWQIMGKVLNKTGKSVSKIINVSEEEGGEWHKTPAIGTSKKGAVNIVWSSYNKEKKEKSVYLKVYNAS